MSACEIKIVGRGVYFRGERVAVLLEGETSYTGMADFREMLLDFKDPEVARLKEELEDAKSELQSAANSVEELMDERDDIRGQLSRLKNKAEQVDDLLAQVRSLVHKVEHYSRDH